MGVTRPQTVVIGETLFVGGCNTDSKQDDHLVFKYSPPPRDEWSSLSPCLVKGFGMAERAGKLIAVGGIGRWGISNLVYEFDDKIREWVESAGPVMPTARFWLSIFANESVIIACGGATGFEDGREPVPCATVEVFLSEAFKWYSVDSLPLSCYSMSSVVIHGGLYLLGGLCAGHMPARPVLHAPIKSLIEKATEKSAGIITSSPGEDVWSTLSEPPLRASAAASLGGSLVAVAGYSQSNYYPTLYGYVDSTDSWVKIEQELPVSLFFCAAVELPPKKVLVIGGKDSAKKRTCSVFMGSASHQ